MDVIGVLLVIAALLVGAVAGWFAGRAGGAGLRERLASERRSADAHAATLERTHAERVEALERAGAEQVATLERAHAARLEDERTGFAERLAAQQEHFAQRLEQESVAARERLDAERADAQSRLEAERAAARERLEAEQAVTKERLDEMRADTKRLSDDFEALSRKALDANTQVFLAQAEERFKRAQQAGDAELAKREEAVKALVEPLSRTLGEVKAEMTSAEKARLEAHTVLSEQVHQMRTSSDSLRSETSQLVTALRAPQVRGRWGELQLRRVVEAAGMVEHVDFEEQETVTTDDGALRPDLVVKLPGGKQVIVDAKVAFSGYLEAMEAKDDTVRAKRLQAHARHVRAHIESLGAKAYWEHFEHTPEFVVMFLPAETFLNAALEQDATIQEYAFERNVVLATPATLVALLRTVAYTWRQELLAAEAQQVFTVGRELHKRLGTMGKHLESVSKKLNSTVDAFNKLNASLDSQVVTQARRFSALQGLEPALDVPPPLEILAVPAQKADAYDAPELTSGPRRRAGSTDARARAERDLVLAADSDGLLDLFESGSTDEADEFGRGRRATGS
ncbi:DNA recombination protein RmuC [Occultella gossypii]|nr:DNA recombination protein RmuC [Occultella gossypii]